MGHPLEKIYPHVPVALQNLGISLYGLAWRHERMGGDFGHFVAQFAQRDRWTPEQMRDYTTRQLRRVLLRAFDKTSYYKRVWTAAGVQRGDLEKMTSAELERLPVTPKADLRADPESFVASDVPEKLLKHYFSSGSTGTPITAICTAEDHRRFIAAREVRSLNWAGTSLRGSRAMIGGRLVVPTGVARPPFYRYNWAERQVYFSAYHIAPAHVADYVHGFNRYQPKLLTGYANSYYLLGRMMIEQGVHLDYKPEAVVLCSEKLTREMKETIREAFGARAYEEYGAVENCMLATECEQGNLHVSPDFGVLEIVDEEGAPVEPGREGRILCTGLVNNTQFLVRYEIGDVGIWSRGICACGRNHLPVLQEIVGRLEDVVVGPDGRELVRFHGIFIDMPNVLEGQVIQETIDQFTVKVVARPEFGESDIELIRQRFAERLGEVRVEVEQVDVISRTERGKFRAVISKVTREHGRSCPPRPVL